jgi:hypothetical protein
VCSFWITCQNNGTCNYNITLNVYSCQCIDTFYGPNCQYRTLNSTTFINSTILTQELGVSLMNLIGVPLNSVATKIYQASVHGFSASQFHSKVDGKLGTLSIIKSTNGNIFGGFTMLSWGLPSKGYNDPNAYLFSLINPKSFPLKLNQKISNDPYSIIASPLYGPLFGSGHDLIISDNPNSNLNSYFTPGSSYLLPLNYTQATTSSNSFLAGTQFFQTMEIEVYTSNTFDKLIYSS